MSRRINLVATEDEEYRLIVKSAVAEAGVYMIAVSNIVPSSIQPDPEVRVHEVDKNETYANAQDAFVYTVGHRERDRPELIVFCGPGLGEKPIDAEMVNERINAAVHLLEMFVENWDNKPVLKGEKASDYNSRVFTIFEELSPVFKDDLMFQCKRYYGDDDFDVLVLWPIGFQDKPVE